MMGYSVVCKNDGGEALDFFIEETKAKHDISGLILDLTVPGGISGKDTVVGIRKLDLEIPVFVSSGYADDPIMVNPAKYGFTASICKPAFLAISPIGYGLQSRKPYKLKGSV